VLYRVSQKSLSYYLSRNIADKYDVFSVPKHYNIKVYERSRCKVPRINLGIRWRIHALAALNPGEIAPAIQWVGGRVDSRVCSVDMLTKGKKILSLPGIKPKAFRS